MKRSALPTLLLVLSLASCATGSHPSRTAGYVDANGVHTYYETHGDGPPLVLLHGAAMVAEGWSPQVDALSRHFTVYVPERRGVGRTEDIAEEWSYSDMAADTAAFMDANEIEQAAVVGVSDGGIIGLILAATRPDLVGQLVVSGANINPAGLGAFREELARMTPEERENTQGPEVFSSREVLMHLRSRQVFLPKRDVKERFATLLSLPEDGKSLGRELPLEWLLTVPNRMRLTILWFSGIPCIKKWQRSSRT